MGPTKSLMAAAQLATREDEASALRTEPVDFVAIEIFLL
jgi:hypothetical protein